MKLEAPVVKSALFTFTSLQKLYTFPEFASMDKVRKLKECLDKEVQDMIFTKIKSDMGGFDRMGKADIESMGDMVGQLSFKEMKNLDAATVNFPSWFNWSKIKINTYFTVPCFGNIFLL